MGGMLRKISDCVAYINAEKAPLELTFGIEAEFLLIGRTPTHRFAPDVSFKTRMTVYRALTDKAVSAACATCGQVHTFTLPVACPENTRDDFSETEWTVTRDSSVLPTTSDDNALRDSFLERGVEMEADQFWGMELRSRPMQPGKNLPTTDSATDPYHRHSIGIDVEITLMLEKLHDAFNTFEGSHGTDREEIRLAVNSNCGVHIHVGNGVKSRGYPLSTVKNVQKLYTANERSIDSIHSCDRVTGTTYAIRPLAESPGVTNRTMPGHRSYNHPNSEFFINTAFGLMRKAYTGSPIPECMMSVFPQKDLHRPEVASSAYSLQVTDFLGLIENASSLADLRHLKHGMEHRDTVNLQNLVHGFHPEGHSSGKVTIEFRQHCGTVDAADIIPWIEFTTKLVQYAHDSSQAKMCAHLDRVLNDPSYDVINLMNELQCDDRTIQHYSHVLGRTSTGCHANWALARLAKQSQQVDLIPAEKDVTHRARHMMAKTAAANLLPTNVQDRVDMKFRLGGYGRFAEAYLDGYKPVLLDREKFWLTAGNFLTTDTGLTDKIMEQYASGILIEKETEPSYGDPEDLALTPPPEQDQFLRPTI